MKRVGEQDAGRKDEMNNGAGVELACVAGGGARAAQLASFPPASLASPAHHSDSCRLSQPCKLLPNAGLASLHPSAHRAGSAHALVGPTKACKPGDDGANHRNGCRHGQRWPELAQHWTQEGGQGDGSLKKRFFTASNPACRARLGWEGCQKENLASSACDTAGAVAQRERGRLGRAAVEVASFDRGQPMRRTSKKLSNTCILQSMAGKPQTAQSAGNAHLPLPGEPAPPTAR